MTSRLVVLISGNGSNLQAILDACASGELPASIVCVISNNADAYGLKRAQNAGAEAVHFEKLTTETRQQYDARLAAYVSTFVPDYVILAGWMRILTSSFLSSFPNRVVNLHPALPGTFPGTHAIERAYEAFQKGEIDYTGVMVHLVPDEGVDDGPVLATQEIEFIKDESLEDFEIRVHKIEHNLLVNTLDEWISSQTSWEPFEDGQTIGTIGSENGMIVSDETHELGARITLEKEGITAPWAITCGGGFVHTVFFETREQAEKVSILMKFDLWKTLQIPDEEDQKYYSALKEFINKY
jgi:phosphoribosylglycinamide formyltransferase 1